MCGKLTRKQLLKQISLLAVILLVTSVFYPAGKAAAADIPVIAVGGKTVLNYSYPGGYDYVWMTNDTDIVRIVGSGSSCEVTGLKVGRASIKVQVMYDVTRFYWTAPTKGEYVTTTQYAQQSFTVRVTKDGTLVTKPGGTSGEAVDMNALEEVGKLSEGLILVKEDGLYGYVDRNFNLVIPFQYSSAKAFQGGVAFVVRDDIQYVIDQTGKAVFSGRGHTRLNNPGDNSIVVTDYLNDKAGYKKGLYSSEGKRLLPTIYDYIYELSEGLRYVVRPGTRGFVDQNGDFVFKLADDTYAGSFHEGMSSANGTTESGEWQKFFLDTKGNIVFTYPNEWNSPSYYSEGLCMMRDGNDRLGYIDREGRVAIPFEYSQFDDSDKTMTHHHSSDFKDGMAVVIKVSEGIDGQAYRYGVIGTANETVIPFEYTDMWYLGEGVFAYQKEPDGLYGLIAKDGTIISKCIYRNNYGSFSEGVAVMKTKNGWCGIDKNGKQVIAAEYDRLDPFEDGFCIAVRDGEWTCLANPLTLKKDQKAKQ